MPDEAGEDPATPDKLTPGTDSAPTADDVHADGWLQSYDPQNSEQEYAAIRQSLDAQAALAASSYATVVDRWLTEKGWTPPAEGSVISPEQQTTEQSDLRRLEEVMVGTGMQIEALAGTAKAQLAVSERSEQVAIATQKTADASLKALGAGQQAAERSDRRLIVLTGVLIALTVVLALPIVADIWHDWLVPLWNALTAARP